MSTRVSLHAGPGAGFDEPFEMLAACHGRVERMLGLLERLARHLVERGADADARDAARDVMRYFDLAGPAHHEDEERHVFPALAATGDPALRTLAARLHDEHLEMARRWAALRQALLAVAKGAWPGQGGAALAAWPAFAALYRAHIAAEERLAYPAVRRLLDTRAERAMGREMAQRRGAPAPAD
jgi:hemerythrin-like domain-containing protein